MHPLDTDGQPNEPKVDALSRRYGGGAARGCHVGQGSITKGDKWPRSQQKRVGSLAPHSMAQFLLEQYEIIWRMQTHDMPPQPPPFIINRPNASIALRE